MSEAGFNPMSIKRLGGRTCHPRVSSSPSKIPYGGFSPVRLQTGEQPRRPSPTTRALSARPASAPGSPTYTPSPPLHRPPVAQGGNNIGAFSRGAPVQRPLARQRVMLSRRVLAYYGLMGASQSRPPIYFRRRALALRSSLGWVREGPPFTLPVCFLRAAFRTPADQTAATGCCFTAFTGLHLLCTGSASADPRRSVLAWAA